MWFFKKKNVNEEAANCEAVNDESVNAEAVENETAIEENAGEETVTENINVDALPEEALGETVNDDANVSDDAANVDETVTAEETATAEEPEKVGFFARLKQGLTKTRDNIVSNLNAVFAANEIDDDFYEEIEEILIMGDLGVTATEAIIANLKAKVKEKHLKKTDECRQILIDSIKEQMQVGETEYAFESEPSIVMVIGVNGVGKTTTVGKLAAKLKKSNRKVLIAAADTFRAAAADQLEVWAERADVPIVGSVNGADPASVVFDAVAASKARNMDVLLIDTAGRLHNKKNLMEELRKMDKIINREYPNAHRENLIVLDGTTGQNALVQAKEFSEVAPLTGIVLTKMDGTAKGGIAVAIQKELNIPVKYIGVGESLEDLQKFDADAFVDALFDVR